MSTLVTISHDDPREVRDAVRTALDGGAPIGLGMLGSEPAEVPEGTAVVIATSPSDKSCGGWAPASHQTMSPLIVSSLANARSTPSGVDSTS